MNDALLVGGGQAAGRLQRELGGPAGGQRPGREAAAERLAFQQLRNDVRRALVRADVEDRRDVRVVQQAGGLGFLFEAPQAIGVARKALGKDLERHVAAQPRVPRAIDVTHPPGAEPREDFVGPEPSLRREWHRWMTAAEFYARPWLRMGGFSDARRASRRAKGAFNGPVSPRASAAVHPR